MRSSTVPWLSTVSNSAPKAPNTITKPAVSVRATAMARNIAPSACAPDDGRASSDCSTPMKYPRYAGSRAKPQGLKAATNPSVNG